MTEQLFDLVVVDYPSSKNIDALVQSIMQMLGEQSPRLEFKLSEALLFNNGMTSIREGLTESEAEDLRKNLAMLGIDCDLRPTLQLVAKDSEEEQDVALYTCPACGHIQPKVKENNKNLLDSCEICGIVGERYQLKKHKKQVLEDENQRADYERAQRIREVLEKAKLEEESLLREEARRQLGLIKEETLLPKLIGGILSVFLIVGGLYYYNQIGEEPSVERKNAESQVKAQSQIHAPDEIAKNLADASQKLEKAIGANKVTAQNKPVVFVDQEQLEEHRNRLTQALKSDAEQTQIEQPSSEKQIQKTASAEAMSALETQQLATPRFQITLDQHADNRRRIQQLLKLDELDLVHNVIAQAKDPYARTLLMLDLIDWHMAHQKPQLATETIARIDKEIEQTQDVEQQALMLGTVSKAHLLMKDWEPAGQSLQQAIGKATALNTPVEQIKLMTRLANEQSLFGNQIAARQILEEANNLVEKLPANDEHRNTVLSQMAASYATLTEFTQANNIMAKIEDPVKRQKLSEFIDKLQHRVEQVRAEYEQQSASLR